MKMSWCASLCVDVLLQTEMTRVRMNGKNSDGIVTPIGDVEIFFVEGMKENLCPGVRTDEIGGQSRNGLDRIEKNLKTINSDAGLKFVENVDVFVVAIDQEMSWSGARVGSGRDAVAIECSVLWIKSIGVDLIGA